MADKSAMPATATSKRNHLRVLLCLLPLAIIIAAIAWPFMAILLDVRNSARERQRLLHETDHRRLLDACRELMETCPNEEISDPESDPRVPEIIRGLGPSHISISEQQVRVELHGGFDHYGVIACAKELDDGDDDGELVDGLRYYSE